MQLAEKLVHELKIFFAGTAATHGVVGLSGGVDSALTLALAVRALGAHHVTGVLLPQEGISSPVSAELAHQVAAVYGVTVVQAPIADTLVALKKSIPWKHDAVADLNLAPRIRMTLLYHYARSHNALVLGTSNKSEILLGYGTKWGDFAADVEVIGSLWKSDVYRLAKELGVPLEVIARPPTAELVVGQTDATELGATYDILDPILKTLEANNFLLPDGADELTEKILARVLANQHKTVMPPVLKG